MQTRRGCGLIVGVGCLSRKTHLVRVLNDSVSSLPDALLPMSHGILGRALRNSMRSSSDVGSTPLAGTEGAQSGESYSVHPWQPCPVKSERAQQESPHHCHGCEIQSVRQNVGLVITKDESASRQTHATPSSVRVQSLTVHRRACLEHLGAAICLPSAFYSHWIRRRVVV